MLELKLYFKRMRMIAFMSGKKLPEEVSQIINKNEGPTSLLFISGGFDVFIKLNNISVLEEEAFFGKFHIVYKEIDIPFLILVFSDFIFDIPIQKLPENIGNAFNIYFVETNGNILKGIRVASLEANILTSLVKRVSEISSYDFEKAKEMVLDIYSKHDSISIAKDPLFVQSFNPVVKEQNIKHPIIYHE